MPPSGFTAAYGSFSSTQSQFIALPATEFPLAYDTADVTPSGVSCSFPSSQISVAATGVYSVLASVQVDKAGGGGGGGGTDILDFYISINGVGAPNSATRVAIAASVETVMTVEWFLQLGAGDYVEVVLYSPSSSFFRALAIPTAPPVPAIPSIITTIQRIA